MGNSMPKAVTSVVVKRWGGTGKPFRAGLAEMNGWRPAMEDAHVVVMQNSHGFFGIFDGHGGHQCSAYVAARLTQELETSGMPSDDKAVTALALKLDKEYLETGQPSGSTGTFVIVVPPAEAGGNHKLRVGNIGDSRVLLGKADGTMVEGPGTDGGLTTDHKPDHPDERARIERTGGTVQEVMGVYRVNGDLAVSRAFGDAQYKETGGPAQEDHPVTAAPEFTTCECGPTDFLILVCDGISESNFPNREVVQYAKEQMDESEDLGAAAAAVCRRALERGSKDNLSCMIVLIGPGEVAGKSVELLPGAVDQISHEGFRKAYDAMASHAGMTLAQAVEARHKEMHEELEAAAGQASAELLQELAAFGGGPPADLAAGSEDRTKWFAKWVQEQSEQPANLQSESTLETLMRNPDLLEIAQHRGLLPKEQEEHEPVTVAGEAELRAAIEAHAALQWDERYLCVCGKEGTILKRDNSDDTSQVRFKLDKPMTAWFPDATLRPPRARVADADALRAALTEHSQEWKDQHEGAAGKESVVLKIDDSKEMTLVRFGEEQHELWLPSAAVARIEG